MHSEDRGQDLAEYCLLTALVALVALAFIIHASGGMQALWTGANTSLTAGNAVRFQHHVRRRRFRQHSRPLARSGYATFNPRKRCAFP